MSKRINMCLVGFFLIALILSTIDVSVVEAKAKVSKKSMRAVYQAFIDEGASKDAAIAGTAIAFIESNVNRSKVNKSEKRCALREAKKAKRRDKAIAKKTYNAIKNSYGYGLFQIYYGDLKGYSKARGLNYKKTAAQVKCYVYGFTDKISFLNAETVGEAAKTAPFMDKGKVIRVVKMAKQIKSILKL